MLLCRNYLSIDKKERFALYFCLTLPKKAYIIYGIFYFGTVFSTRLGGLFRYGYEGD
jgi:hypothetical protein